MSLGTRQNDNDTHNEVLRTLRAVRPFGREGEKHGHVN